MVGVDDFFSVEIVDFCFKIYKIYDWDEKTGKSYITLLRYEGNGEFIEIYTGRQIHFAPIVGIHEEIGCSDFIKKNTFSRKYGSVSHLNCVQFYKQYEILKKSPLLIGSFESLNKEIIKIIEQQENSRNIIRKIIEVMCVEIGMQLEFSYQKRYIEEECLAYGENIVYDFQKGISRKRILKEEEKQEDAE